MILSMRFLVAGILLTLATLACDDETTSPPPAITLSFQAKKIDSVVDSVAYARIIAPNTVELVGFHSSCSNQVSGRLVQTDAGYVKNGIVVDAEIPECGILCIININFRYVATLSELPPGEHRFILEKMIRHCTSGQLLAYSTTLDTVLTIP